MSQTPFTFVAVSLLALTAPVLHAGDTEVDFARDVRPILSGHCFKCHGPDAAKRKADLRLDSQESAWGAGDSGKTVIVPGKPQESELIRRILTEDEDDLMPPPSAKRPLTSRQKDVLTRWISAGAEYHPHWAFVPPREGPLPEVSDATWVRTPIDRFTLAKMESAGLSPSPEADRYTLVRRVYLDLIGLPPTPEQADAFVQDSSPDAYERLVDSLLDSPHYGERWARRWLDLARYADTNGYEKDRPRSMWPYRDWVIDALNTGKPFDKFTIEQIAGDILADELPDDDPRKTDLMVATGFHRNSMINEEGGNDPQEYRFHAMVDRVSVTATTWLGLTMACAQCHTHKFDPIKQSEYYQFMAFLNNADEIKMDVPDPEIRAKRSRQQQKIAKLEADLINEFPPRLVADWITPATATFAAESENRAERLSDGSFLVEGDAEDEDVYTLTLDTSLDRITHLQLVALPDPALKHNGPGRADSGNFILSEVEVSAAPLNKPTRAEPVRLDRARADAAQAGYPAWYAIDGKDNTGWGVATGGDWHVSRTLTISFREPIRHNEGARVTVTLKQKHGKKHLLGRFRLSLGQELPDDRPMDIRRREHLNHRLARWLDQELPRTVKWKPLTPVTARGSLPTLTIEENDAVFVSGDFSKSDTYWVGFNEAWDGVRAIRIEVLPDQRLPNNGPGRVQYEGPYGDFFMTDLKVRLRDESVKIDRASDSFHNAANDASKAIDDDLQSGWSIRGGQGQAHNAVFVFDEPLEGEGSLQLQMIFEKYYAAGLGKFRVWVTKDEDAVAVPHPNTIQAALLALKSGPSETERVELMARLRQHYVTLAPELAEELAEIQRLKGQMPRYPTTLVLDERPPGHTRITHIHKRGDFLRPTEEVEPGVPAFLPGLPQGAPRNRLGLAQWLVSPDNPLTARVVMNRAWEAFFGRGIVRTLDDFGFQGELPSHPGLLDWLAVEFVKRGWSLKEMHKLMVMSATYRQSSHVTPDLLEKDPENVLLARGPRFRLEAELVRDAALVASGLLSEKLGGPSVFPPQLPSISTEGAYGPLKWNVSKGEDRHRRSLYTFAKRTAPFAMTATFDAPSGEACVARRDRSNTPLQSLTLLNDEMFLEMARALGREAAQADASVQQRATALFRRCLTRPPTEEELAKLIAFYKKQAARFDSGELEAAKLMDVAEEDLTKAKQENLNDQAAWAAVARVLMNLDEAITKS